MAHSPLPSHLLLERVDRVAPFAFQRHELLVRKRQVQWLDLLADEFVRPVEHLLVLGVGLEIPRHVRAPLS